MTSEPHPIDIVIGRNLRRLRRAADMSQSDLGYAIGVSHQQVQKYERGTNRIAASTLWECARTLDARVEDFFAEPRR